MSLLTQTQARAFIVNYSIVQINRNVETRCICGSTCEKVSFEVADKLGNVETYGSSCIESILGIDTKRHELKRGIQTLKLKVIPAKSNEANQFYVAKHKELRIVSNVDENNLVYKVVAKYIIVDAFTGLEELSKDKKTINYNYKTKKSSVIRDQVIQGLSGVKSITEKEIQTLINKVNK